MSKAKRGFTQEDKRAWLNSKLGDWEDHDSKLRLEVDAEHEFRWYWVIWQGEPAEKIFTDPMYFGLDRTFDALYDITLDYNHVERPAESNALISWVKIK